MFTELRNILQKILLFLVSSVFPYSKEEQVRYKVTSISFIIVEFSFHAEKKKFIVWRSENLFPCPRAGKQAVFQL